MVPDPGAVVRAARAARAWTQQELADRLHCSRSTIARLETGAQPLTDLDTLRRLAAVLGIAPTALGVAATVSEEAAGEDDVRRRDLLSGLAATAAAAAVPAQTTPAAASSVSTLAARLRDTMLGAPPARRAVPAHRLPTALAAAVRDYDASRYDRLADTLPALLTGGQSAGPAGAATLAEAYNLTTRIMIKLGEDLGWVAADRARTLAQSCGAPLPAAEAARNLAVLARRAGWHDQAAAIALHAAQDDLLRGSDPARTAERGLLVMSAAYTAAHAGDRTGMRELTGQAAAIADELGGRTLLRQHGGGFSTAAVRLHLISAEYAAGDPSAAVAAARAIDPRALPTIERRARYFTDLARAHAMWGRPEQSLQALLAAERTAPAETRARPAVQTLVSGLLVSGRISPQLRGLAARCRVH